MQFFFTQYWHRNSAVEGCQIDKWVSFVALYTYAHWCYSSWHIRKPSLRSPMM